MSRWLPRGRLNMWIPIPGKDCLYIEVIMGAIASQITSLTIVYLTVYSDADQRKHQSSASQAFVLGIHRGSVILKFNGWPRKIIGHLFYTTSSLVHHFKPIREFKLELQSGNGQFGLKSTIFLAVWPWNLTYELEKQYDTSSILLQALRIIS